MLLDRMANTTSPSLRIGLMLVGLPLIWVVCALGVLGSGFLALLRAPFAR